MPAQRVGRAMIGEPMPASLRGAHVYRLRRVLGEGGQGTVYEAEDTSTGKLVALKLLRKASEPALARFKREFRVRSRVEHPALVEFGELAEDHGTWFFTMALVEGGALLSYVAGSESRLIACFSQLADALGALHAAGVCHRDIKSQNVLVDGQGQVFLLDLGLALHAPQAEPTELIGTPAYMAPEQWAGVTASEGTDWYAFGVLLYEALTGRAPFEGNHAEQFVAKTQSEATPVRALVPGAPAGLAALCEGLLRRDPSARFGSREVHAGLSISTDIRAHSPESFLVGRTQELAQLERALAQLSPRQCSFVVIEGPSGIGKTALLHAFAREVERREAGWVLRGRCYNTESVPFRAFDEMLDALARALRRNATTHAAYRPRHAESLVRLFPALSLLKQRSAGMSAAPIDPAEVRARGLQALLDLLGRMSADLPIVMCLDDAQWADADSIELCKLLLQADFPLLLLATVHPESQVSRTLRALDPHTVIGLVPLAPDAARELATRIAPHLATLDDTRFERAYTETAGSPFLVTQWARLMQDVQASQEPALCSLMIARIRQLAAPRRRLLAVVAVMAEPLELPVAVRLAQADELSDVAFLCRENLMRALPGADATYVDVYHDRIREAVRDTLPDQERLAIHRQIAVELERMAASPERQVAHQLAIGSREKAAQLALQGAQTAAQNLSFARAAELYDLTLRLCDPPPEVRVELLVQRATALQHARQPRLAGQVLMMASECCCDPARAHELQRLAGSQLLLSGDVQAGLAVLEVALAEHGLTLAPSVQDAVAESVRLLEQLLARGLEPRTPQVSDPTAARRVTLCLALAHCLHHIDLRGVPFALRALLDALDCSDLALLQQAYAAFVMVGASHLPNPLLQPALERCVLLTATTQDPYAQALLNVARAEVEHLRGNVAESERLCERVERILLNSCVGVSRELGQVRAKVLIMAHADKGDFLTYETRALEWLHDADRRGDAIHGNWLRIAYVLVWMAQDSPARARAEIAQAERSWPAARGSAFDTACALYLDVLDRYEDVPNVHERPAQGRASVLSSPVYSTPLLQGYLQLHQAWGALRELGVRAHERSPSEQCALRELAAAAVLRLRNLGTARWSGVADALEANIALLDRQIEQADTLLERAYSTLSQCQNLSLAACARRRRSELALGELGERWRLEADVELRRLGVRVPERFARTYFSPFAVAMES